MPGFVTIQHRDVYSLVEFSLDEVNKLHKIMDMIQLNFDSTDKEEKEAQEYYVDKFYPFFKNLKKEMEQHAPNS